MKKADPDYVTGKRGRFEIQPPIVHPSFCVCPECARKRKPEQWGQEFILRIRRRSPSPDSRVDSAAYARDVKREIEASLMDAVTEAGAERSRAVTFGEVASAYRAAQTAEGKRIDKTDHIIKAVEKQIGKGKSAAKITRDDYRELLAAKERDGAAPQTILHHANTLLAILNYGVAEGMIEPHQLSQVRRPRVIRRGKPETWTRAEVAILLGVAMDRFEREESDRFGIPLRGLCLVAYLTLMRPANNFALEWGQLKIEDGEDAGTFRLDRHKNSSKGVKVHAALHPTLVRYLRRIRSSDTALVHPNPTTGKAYVDIRKAWNRFVEIANEEFQKVDPKAKLEGKRAEFYTWRHTGASRLAEISNPVLIVRMMGDTSLATVMKHYFDTDLEHMQETMQRWKALPEEEAIESAIESVEKREENRISQLLEN